MNQSKHLDSDDSVYKEKQHDFTHNLDKIIYCGQNRYNLMHKHLNLVI